MNPLDAVKACAMIYQTASPALADLFRADDTAYLDGGDVYAWLGSTDDAQYLIFRGTSNVAGGILDLEFRPVVSTLFPGRIHQGFAAGFDEFKKWADVRIRRSKPLYIAGHSLGGALATLCGWRFQPAQTITFGCPRVGNAAFAEQYPVQQTRYVHDLDPVPHVPFGLDFKHVCPETRIGAGWFSSLTQYVRLGFAGAIAAAVDDHRIDQYSLALQGFQV